jgi:hypothetical protein
MRYIRFIQPAGPVFERNAIGDEQINERSNTTSEKSKKEE